MATPFYSFHNGYGYERLAVVTDVGTVLMRVDQGGLAEIRVVDHRYTAEELNQARLTPDLDSRGLWESWLRDANELACNPDNEFGPIVVDLCTPELAATEEGCTSGVETAKAMRPILQAAGLGAVEQVWLRNDDLAANDLFVRVDLV